MTAAVIRLMQLSDVPAILEIQTNSPEAAQWSQSAYETLGLATEMKAWVAEQQNGVAGFLVARVVANELEILNLAIELCFRRRGIGSALVGEVLSWGARNGAERVFLEVRASNAFARKFYEAHGFTAAGLRPKYYSDPIEDALILVIPRRG